MRMWQTVTVSFLATTIVATGGEGPAFSWQKPHARVLPAGGLEWAPEPFTFAAGKTVRHISFAAGSDANDGASKGKPWKHHPWDPAAVAQAKAHRGPTTYVCKRGTVHRSQSIVPAGVQGTVEEPTRLTSDPSWGSGEAILWTEHGWVMGAPYPVQVEAVDTRKRG